MYTSGEFILRRDDTPFADRQKLLFDKLLLAEQDCNKNKAVPRAELTDAETLKPNKSLTIVGRPKSDTKRFRGKESIFKRPEGPAPRASTKNIPDYHRNPHKWVKYSLGDVSNEDMTEQSNTHAALSFLKELRARRLRERAVEDQSKMDINETEETDSAEVKYPFKQKTIKAHSQFRFKKPEDGSQIEEQTPVIIDPDEKPVFRSSKVIMPEYVVGQKQKRKLKSDKNRSKQSSSKELKLDHLQEPDKEDDTSN